MYEVTKELTFEAAHRLLDYQGKCKNVHGHSYKARISVRSKDLQPNGFVIDFGALRGIIGGWIDDHWDHAILLHEKDPLWAVLYGQDIKIYTMKENPTAEHMARCLYRVAYAALAHRKSFEITAVTIEETATSWATYIPDLGGE